MFNADVKLIFCQSRGKSTVALQSPEVTQYLRGSNRTAAIVVLKHWPEMKSLIGESSAANCFRDPFQGPLVLELESSHSQGTPL